MQASIALGLLAGFAFLMTFDKLSFARTVVIASLIVALVAVGAESSSLVRNRAAARNSSQSWSN